MGYGYPYHFPIFSIYLFIFSNFLILDKKIAVKPHADNELVRKLQRDLDILSTDLTDLTNRVTKFINRERTRAAREAKEINNEQPVDYPVTDKAALRAKIFGGNVNI